MQNISVPELPIYPLSLHEVAAFFAVVEGGGKEYGVQGPSGAGFDVHSLFPPFVLSLTLVLEAIRVIQSRLPLARFGQVDIIWSLLVYLNVWRSYLFPRDLREVGGLVVLLMKDFSAFDIFKSTPATYTGNFYALVTLLRFYQRS
jgi:hypothetical protein